MQFYLFGAQLAMMVIFILDRIYYAQLLKKYEVQSMELSYARLQAFNLQTAMEIHEERLNGKKSKAEKMEESGKFSSHETAASHDSPGG